MVDGSKPTIAITAEAASRLRHMDGKSGRRAGSGQQLPDGAACPGKRDILVTPP